MKRTREVKQAPYNPLDKLNLAKSIEAEILSSNEAPLGDISALLGAGVYAIYYTGDFPAYSEIAVLNRRGRFRQPIYVGKAIPKGGRKGELTKDASRGQSLADDSANTQRPSRRRGICSFPISMSDILWWTILDPLGENIPNYQRTRRLGLSRVQETGNDREPHRPDLPQTPTRPASTWRRSAGRTARLPALRQRRSGEHRQACRASPPPRPVPVQRMPRAVHCHGRTVIERPRSRCTSGCWRSIYGRDQEGHVAPTSSTACSASPTRPLGSWRTASARP